MKEKEDFYEVDIALHPYVKKTAITFEYEVPTVEEFTGRIERVLERYPYLVAVIPRDRRSQKMRIQVWLLVSYGLDGKTHREAYGLFTKSKKFNEIYA